MTSAICHDIGKVYELSDFPMNDYTDAGQLLGHIVMGSEMLGKIMDSIPDFPTKLLFSTKFETVGFEALYSCTSRRT